MKSQGANVEKRANLPVYTISSYTEALAPALQSREPRADPPQHRRRRRHPSKHVCRSVHAEQSDCIIWAYSSICVAASPETRFKLCHPPTQAKFEKWKKGTMQSGHILQPAVK